MANYYNNNNNDYNQPKLFMHSVKDCHNQEYNTIVKIMKQIEGDSSYTVP